MTKKRKVSEPPIQPSPPVPKSETEPRESSVQFMLAEFGRIQAGELYNRSSGETRVNLYITFVSLTGASIVALRQLTDVHDLIALQTFYFVALIALLFISLIGTITFRLLLERWRLTVIYLRKLARIRRWFVAHDLSLHGNLVYPTDETYPPFVSKRFMSSSLITLVSVMNSVSIASSSMFLLAILFPSLSFVVAALSGGVIAIVAWLVHRASAMKTLSNLEKDPHAAFAFPMSDNP